jgi:hypothetical protein
MITPVLKLPYELNQNYNHFFKGKIDKFLDESEGKVQQYKPAPGWLAELMDSAGFKAGRDTAAKLPGLGGIKQALRVERIRVKQRDGSYKEVWGWPAKLDMAVKSTPLTGTALQFGTDVPNSRGQSEGMRAFGYLTGLKVSPLEHGKVAERKGFARRSYLQSLAQSMRDQSVPGPAYKDKARTERTSEYQKVLDEIGTVERKLGVRKPAKPKAGSDGFWSSGSSDSGFWSK